MIQLELPLGDAEETISIDVPEYAPDFGFGGEMTPKGDAYEFKITWKPTGRFVRYHVPRSKLKALRAELAAGIALGAASMEVLQLFDALKRQLEEGK